MNIYSTAGYAFFWVYGCYGAVSVTGASLSGVLATVLALAFTCLMEMGGRSPSFTVRNASSLRVGLTGLCILLIFGFLAWDELHAGLVTDGFYHSGLATAHGQRLLQGDVVPQGSRLYQSLFSLPYGWVLHCVNLTLILVLGYVLYLVTTVQNTSMRLCTWFGLFLAVRFLTRAYVLSGDIHPPLRLFPLLLSAILGGVHEVSFRTPGFVALVFFAAICTELFRDRLGAIPAFLGALFLVSLPLVWHGSLIVEASIWAALAFAAVTIILYASEIRKKPVPYSLLFTLLSLASVMRQSTFVALLPLGLIYLTDVRRLPGSFSEKCQILLRDCLPLILMVPWTLHIAYTGTPATDHSGASWASKMSDALITGAGLNYFWIHWRWPGFALFCIGLIPLRSRAYYFSLATGLFSFALFYSVKPALWGLARYQLEIGFASVAFGLFRLILWVADQVPSRWQGAKVAFAVGVGGLLILFNYTEFKSMRKVSGRLDGLNIFARSREGTIPSLGEYSFATSKALRIIKEKGLHKGNFFDGISYGVMPHVFAGYTWEEVRQAESMPTAWEGADPEKVHQVPQIRSLLLVDWSEAHNIRSAEVLKELGWSEEVQIPDDDAPGNIIRLLRRP